MELKRLVELYPHVYHMAEAGSWENIRRYGLLSTSAILDEAGLTGARRRALEEAHRPDKTTLCGPGGIPMVLRDQKPMAPARLKMALQDGLTPRDWYRSINNKVFFWVSKQRLARLMGARHYAALEHDVLTLDSESLLRVHAERTWLCHMNSGNTFPVPHLRGAKTFQRIPDYPVNTKGAPRKEVVELVVDYSVPDLAKHVVSVRRMKQNRALKDLFP